jgi:hypothetical protein
MPRTDTDPLGDRLKRRLRAELDRVQPPSSSPRYLVSPRRRVAVWRVAPAALAAAVVGMLGLTAYAATGSPNPVVWTQHIMTRIAPNSAPPETTPATPGLTPSSHPEPAAPAPATHEAQPPEQPEPSEEPHATPSPEHDSGGGGGDDQSNQASPSPSPSGGDH